MSLINRDILPVFVVVGSSKSSFGRNTGAPIEFSPLPQSDGIPTADPASRYSMINRKSLKFILWYVASTEEAYVSRSKNQ